MDRKLFCNTHGLRKLSILYQVFVHKVIFAQLVILSEAKLRFAKSKYLLFKHSEDLSTTEASAQGDMLAGTFVYRQSLKNKPLGACFCMRISHPEGALTD